MMIQLRFRDSDSPVRIDVRTEFALAANLQLILNLSMTPPGARSRRKIPYNPDLRRLVDAKQAASKSLEPAERASGFLGWHERGYLPHRDRTGLRQFVTFHAADSFPPCIRREWQPLYEIEDPREQRVAVEAYLDQGRGECHLQNVGVAKVVEEEFRRIRDTAYELDAWVIMPNHVHILFRPNARPMGAIVADWKKHSARMANKLLGRTGPFWAADYFDVYMRDEEHRCRTIRYIENNPLQAGLALEAKIWPWSSARFRDDYGALHLPAS